MKKETKRKVATKEDEEEDEGEGGYLLKKKVVSFAYGFSNSRKELSSSSLITPLLKCHNYTFAQQFHSLIDLRTLLPRYRNPLLLSHTNEVFPP